ncbi:hypothetical protein MKUB_54600 [Mycobacterium kubicae]|uniref:DDE-type integrase/transposase/recombinase n=2 Tax=Mycobacterium kubicae TaxID=120959 RepID=A0ABQ1BW83_9MYCO|nr:hypothetical protein [Mycobacterium kubicae]GFG67970.1 hypothetical protein MKUB_54600 [Mycobacterium kubicae]
MVIWSVEISPPVRQISYKWPTLTNTRIGEGKLYLSAIKDEFSNRIAGYNIDSRTKYCRKAGVFYQRQNRLPVWSASEPGAHPMAGSDRDIAVS